MRGEPQGKLRALAKPLQCFRVARDPGGFFPTAPPLELPFPRDSLSFGIISFRVDQTDRTVLERVRRALAIIVSLYASIEVLCRAYIEAAVSTAKNVDVVHVLPLD